MPITAPTDISNCTLWLDPADATTFTLTGSLVDSWTDKSANGYVLTSSSTSRPARTGTIGAGSRTAVVFDGTNDFVAAANAPINNASDGSFTVFAVVTPSGALNERSIVDGDWSATAGERVCQYLRFDSGQAQTITFNNSGGNTSMQGGSISAGNTYRLCAWCDGPNGELYVNGSSVDTLSQTNQRYEPDNTITIGAQEGGGRQYFPGTVGLVIAYSRDLTPTELDDVDDYITAWLAGGGGGTDGTATPAAIAVAVTLPAVTKSGGGTRSPAATSVPITLPAVTPTVGDSVAPAATSIAVTLPSATRQGGGSRTPAATSVPITLPAATPLASSTVTPAAISIPITLPAVTASGGTAGTATPAAIAVPITLPAPTPSVADSAAPAATSVVITLPAASASGGTQGTANPAAITTTITLPAATPQAGQTALPAAISVPVTIPQATPTVGDSAAPAAIAVTVTLPAASATGGSAGTASPGPITVPITLNAPTLSYGSKAFPAALNIAITLAAATATGLIPDANPIKLTVYELGRTLTLTVVDRTITVTEQQ